MTTEPQNAPGAKAKTKRTPGPWEVHEVEDAGEVISRGFRQVGGMGVNTGEDVEMFSKADAAFVVRACNAHDDLVAALKDARSIAVNAIVVSPNVAPIDHPTIKKIDAALAKANGGAL